MSCEADGPVCLCQSIGALVSSKHANCLDFVNSISAKPIVQLGHCGIGVPDEMTNEQIDYNPTERLGGRLIGPTCIGEFEYGVKTGICITPVVDNDGFKILAF